MSLHPGELANVQAGFTPTFTASADVYRRMQVPDTSGGLTDTLTLVATYPCSFSRSPQRPLQQEFANRQQVITNYMFHFPPYSDVRPIDRLKTGTRTFEVVEAGPRSLNITLEAFCQEIL